MKRLEAGDFFFIIVGLLVLALAAAVYFSAYGHVKVLGILTGAAAIALFLGGLFTGGALGAVFAVIVITVIVRLLEAFPIPMAIVLGVCGIGIIVFGCRK